MVPEARDAIDVRYKQLVADFPFDKDTITYFGGEWDEGVVRVETLFKEIANRSLTAKHALWKGDLWLADDLLNDNYFTALNERAELEASRFAVHTGSYAYWDKRRSASVNASSVIADLTTTPTTRPTNPSPRERGREEERARFSKLLEAFRFTRSPDDPRSSRTPTSPTLNQSEILSSPNPKTRRQRQSEGRGEGANTGKGLTQGRLWQGRGGVVQSTTPTTPAGSV
jgi:hypothetical protein